MEFTVSCVDGVFVIASKYVKYMPYFHNLQIDLDINEMTNRDPLVTCVNLSKFIRVLDKFMPIYERILPEVLANCRNNFVPHHFIYEVRDAIPMTLIDVSFVKFCILMDNNEVSAYCSEVILDNRLITRDQFVINWVNVMKLDIDSHIKAIIEIWLRYFG